MSSRTTHHAAHARRRGLAGLIIAVAVGLVCAVGGLAYILFAPLPGATQPALATPLGRGIVDYRLEQPVVDASAIPAMVAEMGQSNLGARWTRILVHWDALQPSMPTGSATTDAARYDATYLAQLDSIVGQLHAAGINVVMTPLGVPKWASDKTLWKSPQAGYKKGVYEPFYAPDMSTGSVASGQFKALGKFLAARYKDSVGYFECWNEPNQGQYLYPQTPASAKSGGGATYIKMLGSGTRASRPATRTRWSSAALQPRAAEATSAALLRRRSHGSSRQTARAPTWTPTRTTPTRRAGRRASLPTRCPTTRHAA